MKLEIGKSYVTSAGRRLTIGGKTARYPEWLWSIQGDWYVEATGHLLRCVECDESVAAFAVGRTFYRHVPAPEVVEAEIE